MTTTITLTTTRTSNRVNPRKSVSLSRRLPPPSNRATLFVSERLCCMQYYFHSCIRIIYLSSSLETFSHFRSDALYEQQEKDSPCGRKGRYPLSSSDDLS